MEQKMANAYYFENVDSFGGHMATEKSTYVTLK